LKRDAKTVYAQSSDIKARTYLEYRKDMKKKAIAELEIKEWLENKLREYFKMSELTVEKYGGDRFLWFLRNGGITREPDFIAKIGDRTLLIEFQYAEREDLRFYDFKISKVAKKVGNERVPYGDRLFLYIVKPSFKYAFMTPKWIVENGKIGPVPAWGSRVAYRVPKDRFNEILGYDESLKEIIGNIDAKVGILNFQHELIDIWKEKLSRLLQSVVDEEKIVKIVPKSLDSFFKICFILDRMEKIPENLNLWLIYLLSYIQKNLNLRDIAKLTYSLDFLYSKTEKLSENELKEIESKVIKLLSLIDGYAKDDGTYQSSLEESPINETRYALFAINLLEDMIQDMIYYHGSKLPPISRIYMNVKDVTKTFEIINKAIHSYSTSK
jgi:hypothetical protein